MPTLTTYSTQVLPDWVDYNGHLRDAFYLLIFSYATDALMEQIGTAEKTTALTFRLVGGVPVLLEDGHAWTVNTDTNATTRYENYSFNSFATVGL